MVPIISSYAHCNPAPQDGRTVLHAACATVAFSRFISVLLEDTNMTAVRSLIDVCDKVS